MAGRIANAGAGLGKFPARSAARDGPRVRATLRGHPPEIVRRDGTRLTRDAGDLFGSHAGGRPAAGTLLQAAGDRREGPRALRGAQPQDVARKKGAEGRDGAVDPHLAGEPRSVSCQMAQWTLIWLENPEVFPAWVEIRKRYCSSTDST